jgi:hypothetical protein
VTFFYVRAEVKLQRARISHVLIEEEL